jgi:hypothetical protein
MLPLSVRARMSRSLRTHAADLQGGHFSHWCSFPEPRSSHQNSYIVDQLRRGDEGGRETRYEAAHAGAYLDESVASELKLGWRVGRIKVCGACCAST